jgi:hypothetical protein
VGSDEYEIIMRVVCHCDHVCVASFARTLMQQTKRKIDDKGIAVAPPLRPYITDPQDIEEGLYSFLSPPLPIHPPYGGEVGASSSSSSSSSSAGSALKTSSSTSSLVGMAESKDSANDGTASSQALATGAPSSNTITESTVDIRPPRWYQRGYTIDVLLEEAEKLNWMDEDASEMSDGIYAEAENRLRERLLANAEIG